VVARVRKQLYVRRAPAGNAPPTAATVDAT
jgi:hypothetical protein